MAKLTDLNVRSLQPPQKGQKLYYDDTLPSFGVRVSQGGTRSFFLQFGKDRRFVTLGRYPIISLAEARGEAKRQLAEHTLGRLRPQSLVYKDAVALYLEEKAKSRRARTVRDYVRLLGRVSFGQLGDITHDSMAKALKRFTAPSEYNHLVVALRIFFNWCIKRRYITHNPTSGLSTHSTQSRARVLTDHEIIALWKATEAPSHFNTIVRLLLLTGQRVGEISRLQSSWIKNTASASNSKWPSGASTATDSATRNSGSRSDLWTLTLPAEVTKNGREVSLPLPRLAASILEQHSRQGLLFPARGSSSKPFNGWSKSKAALDELSGISGWVLHDIRRTYRTIQARIGTPPHIAERLVNHVSSRTEVEKIYDRHTYLPEMRQAVENYESYLLEKVLG